MDEQNYNNYGEEANNREAYLPTSQESGLNFQSLLKLNQVYANQLLNIVSNSSKNMKQKAKLILPYNDMKVLNSLIKEDFIYLFQLLKFNQFKYEFDALYAFAIKILNLLGEISYSKINLYQKIQKLKFMELKFQSLRISGTDNDFSEADSLLDEDNFKNNKLDEDKCQKKLAQVHEFLAELYDLQKDYEKAYESYDKCYYFYLGRYGINNPLIDAIKKKKDLFEKKKYEKLNKEKEQPTNSLVNKLKAGKITNSKGQTETFSFIVPSTKISEPLIVKIYALPKYSGYIDYFSDDLFLKNIYFDKLKLFEYFGIEDEFEQQNYILYTDDALGDLLEKIVVIDNSIIQFTDPLLYSVFINC